LNTIICENCCLPDYLMTTTLIGLKMRILATSTLSLYYLISCLALGKEDTCDKTNHVEDCSEHSGPERTFILVKPDGLQRGLASEILARFERKGFQLVGVRLVRPESSLLAEHYREHQGKPFYPGLLEYMGSGPVLAAVWQGRQVVQAGRTLLGATDPAKAAPGSIRGDLALESGRNLCHASDSVDSAEREIKLWFSESDLVSWVSDLDTWIHE